jgi:hypothetical protein
MRAEKMQKTLSAMCLMMWMLACTSAPSTQVTIKKVVHVKASYTQQKAYTQKVRALLMDQMGLETTVEIGDEGTVSQDVTSAAALTITMEYMSETVARDIMHAGLQKGARDMDFTIVRFANHNSDPLQHRLSRIWEYNVDGTAKVGFRECTLLKDYSTKCKYNLSDGLAL